MADKGDKKDQKANPRNFRPGKSKSAKGEGAQDSAAPKKAADSGGGGKPKRMGKKKPPAAAVESNAPAKGVGSVILRNEYYRDGYRALQRVAILQTIVILGLIGAIYFVVHVHQPENRYFATTEDGRLVPMVALSEPNLSTPALLSWAAQAATEVMTFGFHDYQRRLQESSRNFTRRGWMSFTEALENARIIETVRANQQVVTAAPTSAPIVKSEGVSRGRYQWVVELPLNITYQAGSKSRSDSLLVILVIVRVPKLESPNGLGIAQWVAMPR